MHHPQRLGDGFADRQPRVKGVRGILEYHPNPRPRAALLRRRRRNQVRPLEMNGSVGHGSEANKATSDTRLTRPGFPHQPERLSFTNREGDVRDNVRGAGEPGFVVDAQVAHLDHRCPTRRRRPRAALPGRYRVEKRSRVLGGGGAEECLSGGFLHHLSRSHDNDAVGNIRHHTHVVGDKENRGSQIPINPAQQIENLLLHRHVKSGGWLVRQNEGGLRCQRNCDDDALQLTAGKLMRVLANPLTRAWNPHLLQQVDDGVAPLTPRQPRTMPLDCLPHLVTDREHRIQRRHGILKHHGDEPPADATKSRDICPDNLLAAEANRPRDVGRGGKQPEDRERGDRFSGAGFTDDGRDLALAHLQRNTCHGFPCGPGEADPQLLNA